MEASEGDVNAAWEYLRKMGAATAQKKSGNVSNQGLVGLSIDESRLNGGIFHVSSETDFVEQNPKFQELVEQMARVTQNQAVTKAITLDEFNQQLVPETGRLVEQTVTDLVGSVRENLILRRGYKVSVKQGIVGSYVHNRVNDNCGLRASLIAVESDGKQEDLQQFARELAMHVVAANPQPKYLHKEDIPESIIEKEKEILREQAGEGKKPEVIEKIVSGRLKKLYQDIVLHEQFCSTMEEDVSINKLLKEKEKELGCQIKITDYVVYNLDDPLD